MPRLATGEAIGCFRSHTESDFSSNPAGMRTRARRDGGDWVLSGTKMWITNGNLADVANQCGPRPTKASAASWSPTDTPGSRRM